MYVNILLLTDYMWIVAINTVKITKKKEEEEKEKKKKEEDDH